MSKGTAVQKTFSLTVRHMIQNDQIYHCQHHLHVSNHVVVVNLSSIPYLAIIIKNHSTDHLAARRIDCSLKQNLVNYKISKVKME